MNYATEIGLDAVIHMPSFIKIGSEIQMLKGGNTQTHTRERTHTHTYARARRGR
jgi:hypothetical protein